MYKEGKDYKNKIQIILNSIHYKDDFGGPIKVRIDYYFPDKRRRDVTNYDKVLLDAMQGIVYNDDNQIQTITMSKNIDEKNPRTEVDVEGI